MNLQKIFLLICIGIFFTSCHTQTNTSQPAPTNFHGIPPQGIGGDSLLNIKKNRWSAAQNYTDMAISDIINLPHDILTSFGSDDRNKWSSTAISQASASEAKSVRVTGYLVNVREEGKETCNGNDSAYHDFHLWIADSSGKGENKSIIAEATPYWESQFPGWLVSKFQSLKYTQVRISGWVMWDEDHPEQIDSSRVSLWEIHPMTKFEYFSNGNWQTLQ